jgi:hypothetical protein
VNEWRPIETAPRDGSWFVIARAGNPDDPEFELGRYDPLMLPRYVEAGDGLYRKELQRGYEWQGFDNFNRATHWMPLPEPPLK